MTERTDTNWVDDEAWNLSDGGRNRRMNRLFVCLALLSAACASQPAGPAYRVMQQNMVAAPFADNCRVRFLNAPPIVGSLVFDQLGIIHVDYPGSEMPPTVRDGVSVRTCRMGGNVVSLLNAANQGSSGMVQFMVYRMPDESAGGEAPAQPAQPARPAAPTTN